MGKNSKRLLDETRSLSNPARPEDSGASIDRQCSSSLMTVATACKQVIVDKMPIVVAGGLESISLVQNEHANRYRMPDPNAIKHAPALYMPMIDTADVVAKRYKISRESQDEYALQSRRRIARAQEAGIFSDEIRGEGLWVSARSSRCPSCSSAWA